MQAYKFLNSDRLLSALNRLGPEGLFDFVFPDLPALSQELVSQVRRVFVERVSGQFGPGLRTDELYKAIFTMWHDGAKEELRLVPGDAERVGRFLALLANYVWFIDNQAEEAVGQIDIGVFDGDVIRRKHFNALMRDPDYVAAQFVHRVVRGQGFGRRLAELVKVSVGRIALKGCRQDIDWCGRQNGTQINHIADWLASAVATEAPWLSNVDEHGRPKKLMKFGTLDAMSAEADKHMQKRLTAAAAAVVREEETFADDGGEYRIVRLTTPSALDRESDAMRHCIGHGAYDRYLGRDEFLLLSLRDKGNHPHITIQVNHGKIIQFFGKGNSTPKAEYRDAALGLLSPLGIEFAPPSDAVNRHLIWYGEPIEYPQNVHLGLWTAHAG
ncbi:hypothetical protein HFN89_01040 [Rhizobium laguerreae]|nr:hypothetical protein [Rhizobium laguerreae]